MCGDVDPAGAIYGVMKTVLSSPSSSACRWRWGCCVPVLSDRGDVGLSFGGCCHVGWDGVEPDTSALCPHQIPQIADGRVRPEHIGYNRP